MAIGATVTVTTDSNVSVAGTRHASSSRRTGGRASTHASSLPIPANKSTTPYNGPLADSDCYTCRRRRVRCDRALQTCRKCAKAGHECAGYKKGFRWVGGIASRGKMMGKSTFDDEEERETESSSNVERKERQPMMMVVGGGPPQPPPPPQQQRQPSQPPSISHPLQEEMEMQMEITMPGETIATTATAPPIMSTPVTEAASTFGYSSDSIMVTSSSSYPSILTPTSQEMQMQMQVTEAYPLTTDPPLLPHHQAYSYDTLHFNNGLGTVLGNSYASQMAMDTNTMNIQDSFGVIDTTQDGDDDAVDLDCLTVVSSRHTNQLAAAAMAWNNYFAQSYSVSSRTGRCYLNEVREYPTGGAAHAASISISALLEYYVSMPMGAPSLIGTLDTRSRFYLSYFDQMCGIFLLFDKHPLNPYRELLLSTLHFPQPALLCTILAVAARYHSNVTGHHAYSSHSSARPDLLYYNQALHYLNLDLTDEEKMLEDSTLASVLFFLFYETMDSGLDTWKVHLLGARKLVALKSKRMEAERGKGAMLTHIQAFLLHSIALFDIIGSTLVNNSPPTGLIPQHSLRTIPEIRNDAIDAAIIPEQTAAAAATTFSSATSIKPITSSTTAAALLSIDKDIYPILIQGEIYCFLACAPQVLRAILKVSTLSTHPYLLHGPDAISPELKMEFLVHRREVLRDISDFSPYPWLARHVMGGATTIEAEARDMWHHVMAFKTAAIIYLYRSLYPRKRSNNGSGGGSSLLDPSGEELPSLDGMTARTNFYSSAEDEEEMIDVPSILARLTHELFTHLDQIPTSSTLYKGTVWPCFIAGTEARTKTQRAKIRKHFELLWGALYCWNVRNGIGALEEMWRSVGEEEEEGEGVIYADASAQEQVEVQRRRPGRVVEVEDVVDEEEIVRGGFVIGGGVGDGWAGFSRLQRGGGWYISDGGAREVNMQDGSGSESGSPPPPGGKKKRKEAIEQDWKGYLKEKGTEWLFI